MGQSVPSDSLSSPPAERKKGQPTARGPSFKSKKAPDFSHLHPDTEASIRPTNRCSERKKNFIHTQQMNAMILGIVTRLKCRLQPLLSSSRVHPINAKGP
ncbi:uncharacterized protein TM35_000351590 [Trypanosoma theileri]|uniref:Uncharacterized protein n=1 Tax=Trypanosoma theileri TaxID=67003 RepID=A0A1X0NL10_9TRYP|nr:uncharacterized protein TM35_000351590 [Trypanosoma theileri]ORC85415.1 hypothetical protein TM35_000351590 [Trypanosoma theileri]